MKQEGMWSLDVSYDGGVDCFMGYWPGIEEIYAFLKSMLANGMPAFRSFSVTFMSIDEINNTKVSVVKI